MTSAHSALGKALRWVRRARGMAQEEFDTVSSRTYVSELERGVRQATVAKVDSIASVMHVHPLTVLTLSYCRTPSATEAATLMARVSAEIKELAAATASKP